MLAETRVRTLGAAASIRVISSTTARCLQLAHDLVDAEAGRLLPWWKVLEALNPLRYEVLRRHEQEDASKLPVPIVVGFVLGLFEGVAPQVEEQRHPQLHERLRPHLESVLALLGEHRLPLVVAERHQVTVI